MSDFGLFESDEAKQAEPRLAARTAAVKLEAAIDTVRAQFGRFLLGATGIDEFGDRWHYSKHDIRAAVEPHVFPNTGTMRRIHNALKQDWKAAHPYKLAEDGGGSGGLLNPFISGDGGGETHAPSSGSMLNPFINSGGGEGGEVKAPSAAGALNPFMGSNRYALDHDDAGFGSMPTGDSHRNQDLDETYHPSSGNLIPDGDFEGYKDSVDQGGPEKVQAHDFTPGGDSGKQARRMQAWEQSYDPDDEDSQDYDDDKCDRCGKGVANGHGRYVGDDRVCADCAEKASKKEAAKLVADIYTDFARSNNLRVASLDTLDIYASTGIHEADYRLLESMIVRAAEEKDDDSDDDDSDESEESDSESDEAPDFGGEEDHDEPDADDEGGESDSDSDDDDEDNDDDDEDYDFGGDDEQGGEAAGPDAAGEQFTVPEQAPELSPQLMQEIPQDDAGGTAPVPPEVIDSLLGLPEGTIEQLLLEEAQQGGQDDPGMSGGPVPPQGGGDDFFGGGGDDAEQEPPRVARRRRVAKDYGRKCPECKSNNTDYSSGTNDYDCLDCGVTFKPYSNSKKSPKKESRQFWAAPDESEGDLMDRQRQQQRDAIDTKFGPRPQAKPDIRDLTRRAQSGDRDAYATLKSLWDERNWKASARRFWAADDDSGDSGSGDSGGEDSSGGGDAGGQQGPPQGMDPSMMGAMMPPPGSQAVQPPQPPMPLENQPAEDALLDTANQAIMQMIDRETAEYQQIIGPLSQALQAVQFAQQVEQAEAPMDVTPPQGTVNVNPSAAPGGAQNPMQQTASRLQHLTRQAKIQHTLRGAARVIANTYGCSERMLIEAMGRRQYEHVAEAFHILPPAALQSPEVRAAANHIGKMFAAENPMFNEQAFMDSVVGPRMASTARERYQDKAYSGPRDKRRDEHGRQDQLDWFSGPDDGTDTPYRGPGADNGGPDPVGINASRGRLPFDQARSAGVRQAGETLKNTPTMDAFEVNKNQPEITDNLTINDLPQPTFKGLPKPRKNTGSKVAVDLGTKVQRWLQRQTDSGLNLGGDPMAERYLNEHKNPASQRGIDEVHQALGVTPHAPAQPAVKTKAPAAPKAVNPVTKKGTWGEWEPTKEASFFTRKVPGWRWDDHLSGYISKEGKAFTCNCGQKVAAPSYKTCGCGKIWNVYAIGDTHHLASDSAEMFIAREIPVRPGVVMANKKMANAGMPDIHDHIYELDDDSMPTWLDDPYERSHAKALRDLGEHHSFAQYLSDRAYNKFMDVQDGPDENLAENWWARSGGADDYLKAVQQHLNGGHTAARAQKSHQELLAMIDKLADWTKYDGDDPAVDIYGKTKPAPTTVTKPPADWATRLPKGDPSKKGGTWTPPSIPRKKK